MSLKNTTLRLLLLILLTNLSSCYFYDGPTRLRPTKVKKELPPLPEKVVAKPLTKAEYLEKAYLDIKESLDDAEVELVKDSIKVLFPNNIVYDNRSTLPSSNYQGPLSQFTELLKKYKKTNILITGHTDDHGNPNFNLALSRERAKVIRNYLQFNGVRSNRLEYWGLGSGIPIASNDTPEGRSRNRRVEFVVLYKDK